ncbi:uncharacterized protein RCO7_02041 [Rhynchosporium graminicola]|uniref:2EXR domain-containing protein n=1 Tax=Rhynchosporium graminicola TaxID=2792576 RepID=A0A1E1KTK4_9HELO|nr:uncharacterized protein RCO7_02041 [Rhynchosporium commune]
MSKLALKDKELRIEALTNVTTRSMLARGVKLSKDIIVEEQPLFPLFPMLPIELRMLIWKNYSSGPYLARMVEIFVSKAYSRWHAFRRPLTYTTNSRPLMLSICHETRAEAMRNSSICTLEDSAKRRTMFNPLCDAIYFRFEHHKLADSAFPGLNTVRHLIVNYCTDPYFLARYNHLEVLTLIAHQYHSCSSKIRRESYKTGRPRVEVEFYKPTSRVHYCTATFCQQEQLMVAYKLKNPNWRQPVLNVMCTSINGKRCCTMDVWVNPIGGFAHQPPLQTGSFWDENCVPEPPS